MRILYFGDASWGAQALELLHDRGHDLVGVVQRTRPTDDELAGMARKLGLPLFQPLKCNSSEFLTVIRELAPDLNLSVSYDQILRRAIIDSAPLGFVNFHAGMLPWYRGRSVINWAIINGESEIGLTGHFVDEGIDTGDIILQRSFPIAWTDTYKEVLEQMVGAFPGLVADTVDLLALGDYERRPQAHLPGSYFPRRGPGDEWLDWHDGSRNLYNKIRALAAPAPGARTLFGKRQLIIWRARFDPDWPCYIATPGQVVGIEIDGSVRVKTGDSTIVLEQLAVGEPQAGESPPKLRIGDRLGTDLPMSLQMAQMQP